MKKFTLIITVLSIVLSVIFGKYLVETVERGTYQIKQAAFTGTMTAHMKPGMYGQFFGDVEVWPVSQTFDFEESHPMPVRFNDGSESRVLGSVRVFFPRSGDQAISLITEKGYKTPEAVMEQLVYPHLGRVFRLTANLMSAKQSFNEKRADFDAMAYDQLLNGIYKTQTKTKKVDDPVTGKTRTVEYKVILMDENGNPQREQNPIFGTGLSFDAFRVKSIQYSPVVNTQIEEQRKAIMEVETAIAESKRAEQDAKTVEMKGKAEVMKAKYEREQEKIRAVVAAEQQLEVAKLEKAAAAETKQKLILLGQGEAERKKLVMEADGALQQKLDAYVAVNEVYADAIQNYKGNWVPVTVMGSNSKNSANGAQDLINLLTAKTAKELNLDMTVKSN